MLPCDLYELCPDKKCLKVMTDCCVDKKKKTVCQTYILENILSYIHPVKPQKKVYKKPVGAPLGNKGCTKNKILYLCKFVDKKLGCVTTKLVNSLKAFCKGKIFPVPCNCSEHKTLIGPKFSNIPQLLL